MKLHTIKANNVKRLMETKSEKKTFWSKIWAKGAKLGSETRFFCHLLKFGLLVFFEIAYNDSLQQYLTSRIDRNHEKKLSQIWVKTVQNRDQT